MPDNEQPKGFYMVLEEPAEEDKLNSIAEVFDRATKMSAETGKPYIIVQAIGRTRREEKS